jgi:hypothetical protein
MKDILASLVKKFALGGQIKIASFLLESQSFAQLKSLLLAIFCFIRVLFHPYNRAKAAQVRERERESVCVCVCLSVCLSVKSQQTFHLPAQYTYSQAEPHDLF